jgi:hypothetical protein
LRQGLLAKKLTKNFGCRVSIEFAKQCVATEASEAVEPKMERKEISTTAAGREFPIQFRSLSACCQSLPTGSVSAASVS